MNEQLLLSNVRTVLIRLEETIIFALIERAQFLVNSPVYELNTDFSDAIGNESLAGFLLREMERVHAKVRRYTSPDEHPFFSDLPEPILPELRYDENPLRPNAINLNDVIRSTYEREIVPFICQPGDDRQYGSAAVCDVNCLQVLSKRIHYGKFVAESKYQSQPELYDELIAKRDTDRIMETITDAKVEAAVLDRIRLKVETYGQDIGNESGECKIDPDSVVGVYARWVIPLTKEVQVQYLLARDGSA